MFTFKQKLSPTLAISIAFYVIFVWTLGLSASESIVDHRLFYYLVIGAVGSCLAAYSVVIGILEIIQLVKKHE